MKRNLSGIYIFSKKSGKREPVCLEECTYEEQKEWLGDLDKETLVDTCFKLIETINDIAEKLDIYRGQLPSKEKQGYYCPECKGYTFGVDYCDNPDCPNMPYQ